MNQPNDNPEDKRSHFEKEMAPISFQELQKFFARGLLIATAKHLNLVEVALAVHADDTEQIQLWLQQGDLVRAHDEHAKKWVAERAVLMAVTVAPWVLVQETASAGGQ